MFLIILGSACYYPDHFADKETQDTLSNLYIVTQPKIDKTRATTPAASRFQCLSYSAQVNKCTNDQNRKQRKQYHSKYNNTGNLYHCWYQWDDGQLCQGMMKTLTQQVLSELRNEGWVIASKYKAFVSLYPCHVLGRNHLFKIQNLKISFSITYLFAILLIKAIFIGRQAFIFVK